MKNEMNMQKKSKPKNYHISCVKKLDERRPERLYLFASWLECSHFTNQICLVIIEMCPYCQEHLDVVKIYNISINYTYINILIWAFHF